MKFHLDQKHISLGITAFLVLCGCILFTFSIFNYPIFLILIAKLLRILSPVINGFLLAYLMAPILNFFERRVIPAVLVRLKYHSAERHPRRIRAVSIVLTILLVFSVISIFVSMIVPQLIVSIQSIASSLPQYVRNLNHWAQEVFRNNPQVEQLLNQNEDLLQTVQNYLMNKVFPQVNEVLTYITSGIQKSISFMWNLILGLILSIYVMGSKEKFVAQTRKITYAFLSRSTAESLVRGMDTVNRTFNSYIVSSVVDSSLIGVICFILSEFMSLPFPVLISVVVGITNIIPFFGPFLGAVPCAIIILMINPLKCLYFILMILVLQQVDGNVIKPRLFGNSTGISGFWVIVSILVGGGLFGVAGMYLGVPVFALIYHTFKDSVNRRLSAKGLPVPTQKYIRKEDLPPYGFVDDENPNEKPGFFRRLTQHMVDGISGMFSGVSEETPEETPKETPEEKVQNNLPSGDDNPSDGDKE